MGKSWFSILFATLIILIMIILIIFLIEITSIVTLGNRVENSLIGAGWAGFSEIDLENIGERTFAIDDLGVREIFLNKEKAEKVVRQYIRENLKLDLNYVAIDTSYISNKLHPVIINEIKIFNPDELPIKVDEVNITRTTIKISVQIPIDIKGLGFKYAIKNVLVDMDSFN